MPKISTKTKLNKAKANKNIDIRINSDDKNIFIVSGRNKSIDNEIKNYIIKLGMNPISLNDKHFHSEDFIEILNYYTSKCDYAIVIYSPDDKGKLKSSNKKYLSRARQNVLLEHGYLISKYGNEKITVIATPKIEKPSDINKIKTIKYDSSNEWKKEISERICTLNKNDKKK